MIDKNVVKQLANEWLEGKDYFLTDITVSPDNRIVIEIDHAEGVWIEDCVALSRYIENHLDRDIEDYELEVGSAGIGQPFKVLRQYEINVGEPVEVLITIEEKVKMEGEKRPKMVERDLTFGYDEVKYTKYYLTFK